MTDGLAMHDSIQQIVRRGIEVTIVVQGMAYSMASVVLQGQSPPPVSQPHLDHDPRAGQMGGLAVHVCRRTASRSAQADAGADLRDPVCAIGSPLNKIIRDTKRTDFYLDAAKALEYG